MKTIITIILFAIICVFPLAADWGSNWETYDVIEILRTLPGPTAPIIHQNFVIFTAPSNLRKVGIAFAHEGFSTTHSFRQLLLIQDRLNAPIPPGQRYPNPYVDTGIQFFVFYVPENLNELEYRIVVNGLWIADPLNPHFRRNPVTGLTMSVLPLPYRTRPPHPLRGLPNGVLFTFHGPPGEVVTVAGCFNNWDPFMFELREGPAGVYTTIIPLPPGTYQYLFFHRGQRHADQFNPRRVYSRDGRAASEIVVP